MLVISPAAQQSGLRFWMNDIDDAIADAQETADESAELLEEGGVDAVADTGEAEPAVALRDALATFPADRIVVFTHPEGDEDYREADGLEDLGVPITFAEIGVATHAARAVRRVAPCRPAASSSAAPHRVQRSPSSHPRSSSSPPPAPPAARLLRSGGFADGDHLRRPQHDRHLAVDPGHGGRGSRPGPARGRARRRLPRGRHPRADPHERHPSTTP